MKKFSKLLALLLALALVFCLAACGATNDAGVKTDAEQIVGSWLLRWDLGQPMNDMLSTAVGNTFTPSENALYIDITFDFSAEDLVLAAAVDETSMEQYLDGLVKDIVDYMYATAEDKGMTKEQLDQQVQDSFGMSVEEYCESIMAESMDASIEEMSYTADPMYYKVDSEQGRIYIAEDKADLGDEAEYMEYSLSGDKLIVNKIVSGGEELGDPMDLEQFGLELPWTFEKK